MCAMTVSEILEPLKKSVAKLQERHDLLEHIHGLYKRYVEELKSEIENLKKVRGHENQ